MDQNWQCQPQPPHSFGRRARQSSLQWDFALRCGVGDSSSAQAPKSLTALAWHPTGLPCPLSGFGFWSSWEDFRNSLGMSFDWADAMHGKCIKKRHRSLYVVHPKPTPSIQSSIQPISSSSTMPQLSPKNQSKKEACYCNMVQIPTWDRSRSMA